MNHSLEAVYNFVKESNAIENINREPTEEEIVEFDRFMNLRVVTIDELIKFVSVYQPNAKLRSECGMNVRVGKHIPPFGGPELIKQLQETLDSNGDAFDRHISYESLHPFMDCNGRSGRALWAWQYKDIKRGFLFYFYTETLSRLGNK